MALQYVSLKWIPDGELQINSSCSVIELLMMKIYVSFDFIVQREQCFYQMTRNQQSFRVQIS